MVPQVVRLRTVQSSTPRAEGVVTDGMGLAELGAAARCG
jgi:hypothetical protein